VAARRIGGEKKLLPSTSAAVISPRMQTIARRLKLPGSFSAVSCQKLHACRTSCSYYDAAMVMKGCISNHIHRQASSPYVSVCQQLNLLGIWVRCLHTPTVLEVVTSK